MQFEEFRRIVTCFADEIDHVATGRGEFVLQVRDEMITARTHQDPEKGLLVQEEEQSTPQFARSWIINRLARVPMLADRIGSYVTPPKNFVTPTGNFLDTPDRTDGDTGVPWKNVVGDLTNALVGHPGGTTSVHYLTSPAGEGKTSLINHLAVLQAREYRAKRSHWLLVPVPLGGRSFLRFDDVVISALVNRLRFQLLYYDAFLELVRLGVLVPAFDGFEEMIAEASPGEALTALGDLVGKLRSAGTVLVAARQAYFDYSNFGSRARFFDAIGLGEDVAFHRLRLNRWDRATFVSYAKKERIPDPENLFAVVSQRLGADHPVLTRAVLVERLVDAAKNEADLSRLMDRVTQDERDYFHEFVAALVEREARYKWTDKSGASSGALLTSEEHHELLAAIATEMWLYGTNDLGLDLVHLVVEMFVEQRGKSPEVGRQIQERIKEHALLAINGLGRAKLAFDHEDFQAFYLGQALGRALVGRDASGTRAIVEKAALPDAAVKEACRHSGRAGGDAWRRSLDVLQRLAQDALPVSFIRQNCGALSLDLLERKDCGRELRSMSFPAGALSGRRLTDLRVSGSYFHASDLVDAQIEQCRFSDCRFERLEIDGSEKIVDTSLDATCQYGSVVHVDRQSGDQVPLFEPAQQIRELSKAGFDVLDEILEAPGDEAMPVFDPDLLLAQRFLRAFYRATALNENPVRQKLGSEANRFFSDVLPRLVEAGAVRDVPYVGKGKQRRLRISTPMSRIEKAIDNSHGSVERFLDGLR